MDLSSSTSAPLGLRKGVEKPRPLKSIPDSQLVRPCSTAEDVVDLLDKVSSILSSGNYSKCIITAIINLSSALKQFGPQLELYHKDKLDKSQVCLRKACIDEAIDLTGRLYLLEVIELRAMDWVPDDKVTNYYQTMLKKAEASGNDEAKKTFSSPSVKLNVNAPDYTPVKRPPDNNSQGSKPLVKDQMLIKKDDPIAVDPGAKDSPFKKSESAESKSGKELILRSASLNLACHTEDQSFHPEFKYTVKVGAQVLKISGSDPELVQTAKIVLDDYFGEHKLSSPSPPDVSADDKKFFKNVARQPLRPNNNIFNMDRGVRNVKQGKGGRDHFSAKDVTKNHPAPIDGDHKDILKIDREMLLNLSKSPLSRRPPENWSRIVAEIPLIEKQVKGHVLYDGNDNPININSYIWRVHADKQLLRSASDERKYSMCFDTSS